MSKARKPRKVDDLTGQKFGRLEAIELVYFPEGSNHRVWLCKCDCGNTTNVKTTDLKRGRRKSCGCILLENRKYFFRKSHGLSGTSMHIRWKLILARCFNKNSSAYKHYGGRGITVCDRWLGEKGFSNFLFDMGEPPSSNFTLDRTNNDGNYCPENCRWATITEQARNKRSNINIYFMDIKLNLKELCVTNKNYKKVWYRLNKRWSTAWALFFPPSTKLSYKDKKIITGLAQHRRILNTLKY